MRAALVSNGVVDNVIRLPDDWTGAPTQWQPPVGVTVVFSTTANLGDTYDGAVFSGAAAQAARDAEQAAEEARVPERKALRDQVAQAITDLDTYLALSTPTNAQNIAQIKRLSQMLRAVLKRLVQID